MRYVSLVTCCVCFNTAATSKCQLLDSQKHEQILMSCSSKDTVTHQTSYSKNEFSQTSKAKNAIFSKHSSPAHNENIEFFNVNLFHTKTCFKHFCSKTKFQAHSKTTFVVATIAVVKPNKSNPRRHGTYCQRQSHQTLRIRVLLQNTIETE